MTKAGVTIYLVRHGETYLNYYRRMQGWADAPLTDRGIIDIRRSGRGLKDVKFDAVYSSDLQRAITTTEIILDENIQTPPDIKIISMPEFREIFFGSFEGEIGDNVHEKSANHLGYETTEQFFEDVHQFERMDTFSKIDPEGHAETFSEFWLRVNEGLLHLIDTHQDKGDTVLLVSHGEMIRVLLEKLFPDFPISKALGNASVSILKYENGSYHLESYGDISHFVDEEILDD